MAEPLDAREVTIGQTRFEIRKLLPEEQLEVFEHVSPGLANVIETLDGRVIGDVLQLVMDARTSGQGAVETLRIRSLVPSLQQLLVAFLRFPAADWKYLRSKLFPHVTIHHPQSDIPLNLAGNENLAFLDGEMVHIKILTIRAFWVNFSGSFLGLLSLGE